MISDTDFCCVQDPGPALLPLLPLQRCSNCGGEPLVYDISMPTATPSPGCKTGSLPRRRLLSSASSSSRKCPPAASSSSADLNSEISNVT
jgi:hypothetical protein